MHFWGVLFCGVGVGSVVFSTSRKGKPNKRTVKQRANMAAGKAVAMLAQDGVRQSELLRWDGLVKDMPHCSFDCPPQLTEALNRMAKRRGTSVCDMLQIVSAALVIADERNELPTVGQPSVVIGEVNFTQEINRSVYPQRRSRRNMTSDKNPESEPLRLRLPSELFCEVEGCRKYAVTECKANGKHFRLCEGHAEVMVTHPRTGVLVKPWRCTAMGGNCHKPIVTETFNERLGMRLSVCLKHANEYRQPDSRVNGWVVEPWDGMQMLRGDTLPRKPLAEGELTAEEVARLEDKGAEWGE